MRATHTIAAMLLAIALAGLAGCGGGNVDDDFDAAPEQATPRVDCAVAPAGCR